MSSRTFLATSNSGTPRRGSNLVPITLLQRNDEYDLHLRLNLPISAIVKNLNNKVFNSLAKKLSEEGSQHQKKEINNDQTVQSLSHHGLPTL